jgi:hypothetical protein
VVVITMPLPNEVAGASPETSPQQDDQPASDQDHTTADLLVTIGDYTDRSAEAADLYDRGSLDVGRAIKKLYDSREWVEEYSLTHPIKDRLASRGPKPKADSRSRFNGWLNDELEAKGFRPIAIRRTNQLIVAAKVLEQTGEPGTRITSEKAIRPLVWMIQPNQQYGRFLPEVLRRAIELAGSVEQVTAEHTAKARAQWLKGMRRPGALKEVIKTAESEKAFIAARAQVQELWDLTHPRSGKGREPSERDKARWREFEQWYRELHQNGDP